MEVLLTCHAVYITYAAAVVNDPAAAQAEEMMGERRSALF